MEKKEEEADGVKRKKTARTGKGKPADKSGKTNRRETVSKRSKTGPLVNL